MRFTGLYKSAAILSAVLLLVAGCANATEKTESGVKVPDSGVKGPRIAFDKESIDGGKIALGKTVKVDFPFKNIGTEPLTITQEPVVRAVEGC